MTSRTFLVATICLGVSAQAQTPAELVSSAFQHREIVKSAELQLEAAKKAAASSGAYPQTRLEAGTSSRPDVTGGEDLTLFQPIDLLGKTRALRDEGRAQVKVSEASLRQAKLTVQSEVLTAYAAWLNAERSLRTARDQLGLLKQIQKATDARVEARALPELQSTRARLEVVRGEQVVADREAAKMVATITFRQALGADFPASLSADGGIVTSSLAKVDLESKRPELLTLAAHIGVFEAQRRQANLRRLPDFEVQARRSPWSEAERYGIRLQAVIPLYDHGAASTSAKAASLQSKSALLEYTDTLRKIQAEYAAAIAKSAAAESSVKAFQDLVALSKDLAQKTQKGYELGAETLVEVFDAKRALDDSYEQLNTAKLNLDLAVEALLRASGQILGEGSP